MADTARLYRDSGAERWGVTEEAFAAALERSREKGHASLHLKDLALACGCAAGDAAAWEHFVTEFRPALYRAADAIDRTGAAREIADGLYGELFSRSLFRYFHGRSSLATWLRALVAQRFVDRLRETRRLDPLPDEAVASPAAVADTADRSRFVIAMQTVLAAAIVALEPRDRLRLRCYYAEEMTLAQIGRVTRESEATVSRALARTRKAMRGQIEARLRADQGFSDAEVRDCISSLIDDAGTLDLGRLLSPRKKRAADRSNDDEAIPRSSRDGDAKDAP
jgi:RNA polymerase sigma factor (sigma-70 family)